MLTMKPGKVLAPILLAIGLVGINPSLTRADTKPVEMKPIDTRAQDVADLKALEDRFITAFRAKDVNTIMQLCVPDESLVVFDVTPPLERKGADAYRKDWEDAFNRFEGPLEAEVTDLNVTAGGDVAFAYSIHHVIGTMRGGRRWITRCALPIASKRSTAIGSSPTRTFLFRSIYGQAKQISNRSSRAGVRG